MIDGCLHDLGKNYMMGFQRLEYFSSVNPGCPKAD